jgi:hypothetical protein
MKTKTIKVCLCQDVYAPNFAMSSIIESHTAWARTSLLTRCTVEENLACRLVIRQRDESLADELAGFLKPYCTFRSLLRTLLSYDIFRQYFHKGRVRIFGSSNGSYFNL